MSWSTYIEYSSTDRFKTYSYFINDHLLTIGRGSFDTEVKEYDLEETPLSVAKDEAAEYLSGKVNETKQELLDDWKPQHPGPFIDPRWEDENYELPPI